MSKILHAAIVVLSFLATGVVAQSDQRIQAISNLRDKIDRDIAAREAEPEYSTIYLTELAVNKDNGSYPVVGIYRPVVKFYYTYGDREKEPYPNRLLKIVVAVARSDRQEYSEFLFNEKEQMAFYQEKKDGIERRIYFAVGRPIRFEQDGRMLSLRGRPQISAIASVLKEKTKLVAIFRRSLEF